MAHQHRFYIAPPPPVNDSVALSGEESHHALKVVRARVGDAVSLFDGRGREYSGIVSEAGRRDVIIALEAVREVPPPAPRVILAQAWLHREKSLEELIRRGTELGVTEFCFFRGDHSERDPKVSDKFHRLAVEVCKQCGRSWLPEFTTARNMTEVLARPEPDKLMASMDAPPVPLKAALSGRAVIMIVGPEGDFTPEETEEALAAGVKPVSLGATTFRSEIAGAVLTTLVQYELGKLGPKE